MPRRHPNHPRRRPGRRPPHGGPGPRGFTEPAMRPLYDSVLPMRGRDRKRFYNQASSGLVAGLGLGGAMIGFSWAGPVGAILGVALAVAAGGSFVHKGRFYRR